MFSLRQYCLDFLISTTKDSKFHFFQLWVHCGKKNHEISQTKFVPVFLLDVFRLFSELSVIGFPDFISRFCGPRIPLYTTPPEIFVAVHNSIFTLIPNRSINCPTSKCTANAPANAPIGPKQTPPATPKTAAAPKPPAASPAP